MTVYSFSDTIVTFSHPSVGSYTLSGDGTGSISVSWSNDNTTHDVAADGHVMVSKIKAGNGTAQTAVQQTSAANNYLRKWYNYITTAPSSEWARAQLLIKAPNETITMTGVSPQKRPDRAYQAQGQQVTWGIMFADGREE